MDIEDMIQRQRLDFTTFQGAHVWSGYFSRDALVYLGDGSPLALGGGPDGLTPLMRIPDVMSELMVALWEIAEDIDEPLIGELLVELHIKGVTFVYISPLGEKIDDWMTNPEWIMTEGVIS